jgi:hypothetical protein
MRAVLDAADVEQPVVLERAERDTVIATARHTPFFELEQRLGQPVRVGRRGGGDEFGDRNGDFVWQSIECTARRLPQPDRLGHDMPKSSQDPRPHEAVDEN